MKQYKKKLRAQIPLHTLEFMEKQRQINIIVFIFFELRSKKFHLWREKMNKTYETFTKIKIPYIYGVWLSA